MLVTSITEAKLDACTFLLPDEVLCDLYDAALWLLGHYLFAPNAVSWINDSANLFRLIVSLHN